MPNALRGLLLICAAELVEGDPEDTFFHFVNGIWREAEATGNTCKVRAEMSISCHPPTYQVPAVIALKLCTQNEFVIVQGSYRYVAGAFTRLNKTGSSRSTQKTSLDVIGNIGWHPNARTDILLYVLYNTPRILSLIHI